MSAPGFLLPSAAIGFGAISFRPQRGFSFSDGSMLTAQATIEELHHDEIQITDHPVERGAMISDHMFKMPSEVKITCAWSNSPSGNPNGVIGSALAAAIAFSGTIGAITAAVQSVGAVQSLLSGNAQDQVTSIYAQLLALQISGMPFDVFTGKRVYSDMLFKSLSVSTDSRNENSLLVTAVCRQIIIVNTTTVTIPINADAQKLPQSTTPVVNSGTQQLAPAPGFISP